MNEKEAYFIEAQKHALSLGLTSIQSNDIGALDDYWTYDLLAALYRTGIGKIRFRHQICPTCLSDVDRILEEAQRPIYRKGALRMGPIKLFKDGGIGARTAMLRKGYTDDPGNKGSSFLSLDEQVMYYKKAQASGVQILTHVIGDGAIEETLDAYTQVEGASGNPLRHGLIHCQVTDQPLLKRISAENMAVFFQPGHRSVVLHQMVERCGPELTATSFAWNTLKQMGCHCSYGTDAPVIDLDPFPSIQAALTDGNGYSSSSERVLMGDWVDLYTAIDAYTLESAYCEGMEEEKGRIQPGYLADFTVIDQDIFEIGLDRIAKTQAKMTVIGGNVVWNEGTSDSKRAPGRGADNKGASL